MLITGAAGFIGANISHRLTKLGLRPHLVVRKFRYPWRIKSILSKVVLHECDLTHERNVESLIQRVKPKYIIHCASYGNYPSQTDPKPIVRTNILGTFYLLSACLKSGFRIFINSGSSSEYGFQNFPCTEETLPKPNGHYAWSKLASTLYCEYVAKAYRASVLTFRFYSVYGPYEEPTRLIPTLIRCSFEKKSPSLVSAGVARDFIHIDDVVDLCVLALKRRLKSGGIFNIGTGKQSTLKSVVSCMMQITNTPFDLRWGSMPNRIWDTNVWVCNNQKVKREFNWSPKRSLKTGLTETIRWYQNHRAFLYPNQGV